MAKPPSGIAGVQDLFATLSAARFLRTGSFFAAELGQAGKAAKPGQTWVITTMGGRNRKVTVKSIPSDKAFMRFSPVTVTSRDVVEWKMAHLPLDELQSAAERLVKLASAHANSVERRGDEIDNLLGQIRANMSALRTV